MVAKSRADKNRTLLQGRLSIHCYQATQELELGRSFHMFLRDVYVLLRLQHSVGPTTFDSI